MKIKFLTNIYNLKITHWKLDFYISKYPKKYFGLEKVVENVCCNKKILQNYIMI